MVISAQLRLFYFFFKGACVCKAGRVPHLNFRKVRPRLPRTDVVQIAIAAPSLAFEPRALTVFRTDFTHLQNLEASIFRLVPRAISLLLSRVLLFDFPNRV
jgi:hypothetical protein